MRRSSVACANTARPRVLKAVKLALLALMFVVAACGSSAAAPTHQLDGTIHLTTSGGLTRSGASCAGTGGYEDFQAGTPVTVKNEAGTIIASGALGSGVSDPVYPTVACNFAFTVKGVPQAKFYSVEVSHRGAITYSAADLAAKNWKVTLSIG